MLAAALVSWLAAAVVLWCGQSWQRPWLASALVGVTVLCPAALRAIAMRRRTGSLAWPVPLALIAASAAVISAGLGVAAVVDGPVAGAARTNAVLTVDAVINSDTRLNPPGPHRPATASVQVQVVWARLHGQSWRCGTPAQVILTPRQGSALRWGQHIRLTARARPSRVGARAAAVLIALEPPVITHDPPWWAHITQRWRDGLRAAAGNGEAAELLPALAIGDTSLQTAALTDDMRIAGLSHLSAVSGANLSIVVAAVVVLAMLIGLRARSVGLLALLAVAWFVAVARPSPSVLRAAAMGAIGLAPLLAGTRRIRGGVDGLYALALASCVLIAIDPWLSLSWGYALSFFATLGLVIGAGPLQRRLNELAEAFGTRVRQRRSRRSSAALERQRLSARQRILTAAQTQTVLDTVMRPAIDGMRKEGSPFTGFLYAGLMMTADGPKTLEFNVRMGDPETQPIMYRLRSDLGKVLLAGATGQLAGTTLDWSPDPSVAIVLAAAGYPGKPTTGDAITGIDEAEALGEIGRAHV